MRSTLCMRRTVDGLCPLMAEEDDEGGVWRCQDGHVWYGKDDSVLRSRPWPAPLDDVDYWAEIGPADDGVDEALDRAVCWFGRALTITGIAIVGGSCWAAASVASWLKERR